MFPISKVPIDGKEISRNDFLGNERDDIGNTSGEDRSLNLPLKRNWCSYMEPFRPDLTQPSGSGIEKRFSRESLPENRTESNSCSQRLENPQGSIACTSDSLLREAKISVGSFVHESGIDFNVVQSPSFQRMISHGSKVVKDQIRTCQELKGMKEMRVYVDEMRNSWAKTGCSILLDGWIDANGRSLMNILVDCPRGTIYLWTYDVSYCLGNMDAMLLLFDQVINDVGIENIVQIVTYSPSNFMKELGKKLENKYRSIFFTVDVSSCIKLMLEKIEKMDLIKETLEKTKSIARFIHSDPNVLRILRDHTEGHDLIKPSKIRPALPFLTLENIVSEGKSLKRMFLSSNPESSILTSTMEGKMVAELVGSRSFWSASTMVLNAAIPLVRVMEWMNENKAQMGYIYETIDQAKETIREGFKSRESQYVPFWKAVDDVWDEHLYSPLHSAGYFLNPCLFYCSDACTDGEVTTGLIFCVTRASNDLHVLDAITLGLEEYRKANGAFRVGSTIDARSGVSPALWWSKYGEGCPELQQLAIRILNQTCDGASGFQLKRSLAEALFTSEENQEEQQRLRDMIFLHYNLQLQSLVSGKSFSFHEFDPMNDWILNKAPNDVSVNGS